MGKAKLVIWAGFLFTATCILGQPMSDKLSDENYYNDDYYQMTSDDDYLSEEERIVHRTPNFKTEQKHLTVNEGETIKLPCLLDTLEGFVLMWKLGEKAGHPDHQYLAIGDHLQRGHTDSRFKLEKPTDGQIGNFLVITLANPNDTGEYICMVSSAKKTAIKHQVTVRVAPEVQPKPSNGVVIVEEGQSATLACEFTKGFPVPDIKWSRKARKMPTGRKEMHATGITFPSSTRHDSGIYICSADNGFGDPATAEVILDVQHKPEIETEQTFIHTREGDNAEVVCTVHSSPKAKVQWFKNGRPLGEREAHVSHRNNKHSLHLFTMTEESFGTYECRAENKLGLAKKSTQVSGKAAPPNFKSKSLSSDEDKYALEWVAESISNISMFKVEYRPQASDWESSNRLTDARSDSSGWTEVTVKPVHNEDTHYSGKHVIRGLKPQTRYLARVSSKNNYGFNEPKTFEFGTKGAVPLPQPSEAASGGSSVAASLCLMLLSLSIATIWRLY